VPPAVELVDRLAREYAEAQAKMAASGKGRRAAVV
jgi:hypothetical protein